MNYKGYTIANETDLLTSIVSIWSFWNPNDPDNTWKRGFKTLDECKDEIDQLIREDQEHN